MGKTILKLFVPGADSREDERRLLTIGSVIAVMVFFLVPVIKMPDTAGYLALANWIVGKASLEEFLWFSHRTPGYPLIIVLSGGTAFKSLIGVKTAQLIMAVLTPILLYRIGLYFSRLVAYYSAFFYLCLLIPFAYSTVVYSETSFIFFHCLSICLALKFLRFGKVRDLFFLCLSVWFMSMIRYGLLFLVIFFVIGIKQRKKLPHIAAAFVLVFGLFAGWSFFRSKYSGLPFSALDITNASYRFGFVGIYLHTPDPIDESYGPATARMIAITRKYVIENYNDQILEDTAKKKLVTPEARFFFFERFKGRLPEFVDNIFISPTEFYSKVIQESLKKDLGIGKADELYRQVCIEWVRKYPVEAITIFATSFTKHFLPLPVAARSVDNVFMRQGEFGLPLTIRTKGTKNIAVRWLAICAGAFFLVFRPLLGLAMLAGFFTALRTREWPGALLLFLLVVFQAAQFSMFSVSISRFVFHTLPMEMVLGTIGVLWFVEWIIKRGEFFQRLKIEFETESDVGNQSPSNSGIS